METQKIITHLETSKENISFHKDLLMLIVDTWTAKNDAKLNFFQFGNTIHVCRKGKSKPIITSNSN